MPTAHGTSKGRRAGGGAGSTRSQCRDGAAVAGAPRSSSHSRQEAQPLSLHQASGTGDAPDLGSEHVLVRQLGANRSL